MAQETSTSNFKPLMKRNKGNSPVQLYYFESHPDVCLSSMQVKAILDAAGTAKAMNPTPEAFANHLSEKILGFSEKFLDVADGNGYGTEEEGTDIHALVKALADKKEEKNSTPADPYSAEAVAVYLSTREPNKAPEEMFAQLLKTLETKKDEVLAVLDGMHRDPESGWLYRRIKAAK